MQGMHTTILRHLGEATSLRGLLMMSTAYALCVAASPSRAESPATSAPAASEADATASKVVSFNIPAQDLEPALLALAHQAGVQLVVNSGYLRGLKSAPVIGRHTPRRAADIMLKALPLAPA